MHLAKLVGAASVTHSVCMHKSLDLAPVFSSSPAELARAKDGATGDDDGAIRALTEYAERYGGDERAWLELGRAHAVKCAYDEALFCYEEVMCAMPFDPSAHRRAAETLYSMGGERNLRDAKNHFAAALDFTNGRDVRAMYGVVLCAKKLREYAEGGRAEGGELAAAAAERLLQRYVEENESLLGVVRPQLKGATS